MAVSTAQIYDWIHSLVRNMARYSTIAYDDNWLYASDTVSLYQVSRDYVTWKDWKAAHLETWGLEDVLNWHGKQSKHLACGDYVLGKAPKVESIYSVIGAAVGTGEWGINSTEATQTYLKNFTAYYGYEYKQQRILDALECPLFPPNLQVSVLTNGVIRFNAAIRPKAYAYIMRLHKPE